jgi:predicted O-methyltransferase YrrM
MNTVIENIYATKCVTDAKGNRIELHSNITEREGAFITGVIRADPAIKKSLEVGCAYGLSSLFICSALTGREGVRHTILDPNQMTQWKGVGVENLRRAGIDFYTLIQDFSQFALPRLAEAEAGIYDLILVDGYHTFDHTLMDMFFADILLRSGGYLIVDDTNFLPVRRAVAYFNKYAGYEIVASCLPVHSRKARFAVQLFKFIPKLLWPPCLKYKLEVLMLPTMMALKKSGENVRDADTVADF